MKTYFVKAEGRDPRENLALEEYIINNCREDEVWLYLWQNSNTVVIGRNQNPWRECNMDAIRRDNVTLVRRNSGGGAVFHDDGNLNFTFVAPDALYSLERQLTVVLNALKQFGLYAEFSGRNDILLDGRKFSGNAFSHQGGISMQHGTLLIHTDMTRLSQYLSPSADKLKAKGVASVRSRVCNLQDACKDIEPARLCEELLIAFEQEYAPVQARLVDTALDKADYQDLIDKYSSWEWIIGQTPAFQANYETRFAWGEVQLCFDVLHGAIQSARVFSDAMDADLIRSIEEKLPGVRADRESLAVAAGSVGGERAQEAASWIRTLNI